MAVDGELAAGCCLYTTSGPYVFVEHVATNPNTRLRDRHAAIAALAGAVRDYGVITGKLPFGVVRHRGLARVLQRAGWKKDAAPGVWYAPVAQSTTAGQ